MKKILLSCLAVTALSLNACVTIPLVEPGSEDAKRTTSFSSVPDRGVIYIYRSADSEYGIMEIPVSIGDAGKVSTASTVYSRVEVKPGTYVIEAHTAELTADIKSATVTVHSGDVAFVKLTIKARFMLGAKGELSIIQGKTAMQEITGQNLMPMEIKRL